MKRPSHPSTLPLIPSRAHPIERMGRSPSPARRKAAANPVGDSPTGQTAGAPPPPPRRKSKENALEDVASVPEADATEHGPYAAKALSAVTVFCFGCASGAAVLTSSTFASFLALSPHADDLWGLKASAALLRFCCLVGVTLRSSSSSPQALAAGLARVATGAAVEASVLFSQHAFTTVSGGVFRVGDVTRAATQRFSRRGWLATNDLSADLLILALACTLYFAERRQLPSKNVLKGYPRIAVSVFGKSCYAIFAAALYYRLWALAIWSVTSVDVTDAFAMLPTGLFMSRHELSLFRWSVPSSLHLILIIGGDLCMSNPALPPPLGAGGALALGGGLWLAGVMPTAGFALEATMWLLHATCHLALAGYAPPKAELKSRFALVDVRAAGHRMSAAKLQLRVGGYRKPRFWSFDDAAKYAPSPPNEHALPLALSPIPSPCSPPFPSPEDRCTRNSRN